jgi:hypothetical protein
MSMTKNPSEYAEEKTKASSIAGPGERRSLAVRPITLLLSLLTSILSLWIRTTLRRRLGAVVSARADGELRGYRALTR